MVVVLTRERGYRKDADASLSLLEKTYRKYPAFLETMRQRTERYNASRDALFALEAEGKVLVIAPEDTYGCSRTEKDPEILRALWQAGYFAGRRCAGQVQDLWFA